MFAEQVDYLVIIEKDGQKRVIKANSDPNIDICRKHMEWTYRGANILELRRITDYAEIQAAAEKIREDPDYRPIEHVQDLAPQVSGFVDPIT